MRRVIDPLKVFLRAEAAGGIALAIAAVLALLWVNSPFAESYRDLWSTEITLGSGWFAITEDLRHWVNDGLMAVFFFVVGLEIKRELVTGELRDPRAAVLPAAAAVAGVVAPAAIFLLWTGGTDAARGWGIPMATDIAFAVGVMALLGARVHAGAKLFLLTIAIVDDIIAITVIALVYSDAIELGWLLAALGGLLAVVALRRAGVGQIWPYVLVGIVVWVCTLESGVHATIAGVALGLLTPARPVRGRDVLWTLEHRLHPWSAFLIVPLFALANTGVELTGSGLREAATSPLALGIATGLVVGKILGISAAAFLFLRLGWGTLPNGVGTPQVWGVAALAGIGFTVSLFIAELAYDSPADTDVAKIGIFAGSAIAGIIGTVLLARGRRSDQAEPNVPAP